MSIYKPNGCKVYWIDFWFRQQRYYRSTSSTSFSQAKREEKIWKAELREAGHHKSTSGSTFQEVWKEYDSLVGKNTANPPALHAALEVAEGIVGSGTPVAAIDDRMMLQYREQYQRLPAAWTRTRGVRENSSINDFSRLIFRIVNYAKDYLHEDVETLKPAKWLLPETWRMRELTENEEKLLDQDASTEPGIRLLSKFIIETGLRRQPACGLRLDQVDTVAKKITVIEKGKKPHVVPLSEEALKILRSAMGEHHIFVFSRIAKSDCHTKRTSYKKGDRVEIKPNYFWKAFNASLKRVKIRDFTVHDLRHTAATRLLRVCGNIAIIQRFLGHTTLKQTTRYTHIVEEDVAGAIAMSDVARMKKNLAKVAELQALPNEREAVDLHHIFLALDLRQQLSAYFDGRQRQAA